MLLDYPHRRLNILTGEWVLVSPHRAKRPWQGMTEEITKEEKPSYDPACYLCPGNSRANDKCNPAYEGTFVFDNDFSALLLDTAEYSQNDSDLLIAQSEKGICRVICFSERHDLTLAEMEIEQIENVIRTWQNEYKSLGSKKEINHVQIFENKGAIMGCSNPHPHGQIWAQESIPVEPEKELIKQAEYYKSKGRTLLSDYIKIEKEKNERIIYENDSFVLLVPFWAVWPFETMIISKRSISNILEFTGDEINLYADIVKKATVKYDNIFKVSFPYSAGIHQAPTDGKEHKEWHFHMHFYPPLLRSATVKKFMVGYEMLANPQRDITPEYSAKLLKELSTIHYRNLRK
ncbi:MAG: UDP-glucose--hexose-1-phosphate uridylyltransferase [Ignavibacteria bacterium]|jgi:UDPglucose--hexose-1-phosphate uridylyltransferase